MTRRWADPTAFRADPSAVAAVRPSRRQSIALLAVLALVAGVIGAVSYLIQPDRARAFDLLHGSVLIADQFGPVNIDLASGRGTLQLRGADGQVGVKGTQRLSVVPFNGATLLLNNTTGEFNMVDSTGFVIKRNGGVIIGGVSGSTSATGIAAGSYAYIERTGTSGTSVLLVGTSTVSVAASAVGSSTVKARGTYVTPDVGSTAAGGSASANGDLWALFTTAKTNTVDLRQLSIRPNSSTGDTLKYSEHGTIGPTGTVASLESSTSQTDGDGPDVVGLATPGKIQIFSPDGSSRTVRYNAPAGTDAILPTTNAHGRLSYLVHATSGWSMVSVASGGGRVTGPANLRTIEPSASLATPASSGGALYTMTRDGSSGSIYRIDGSGKVTAVAAAYPQKMRDGHSVETASFADAYLIARGSRVIVDSPGHYLALTVFTDGSHAPLVIEKTKLTSVNAAGGAEALTRGVIDDGKAPTPKPADTAQVNNKPAPTINNKINCKLASQKPHVPIIASADPAARSVGLSWTYPRLDNLDCVPSTYVLSVKLLSNNAPAAPGSLTIQGQTDTIVAGLYPNTTYQFTVTAYINGQGTSSEPRQITTGKEGPASPTGLSVKPDASGNWDLSWRGCGSRSASCVPADSWTILPSFCDGSGLSASPTPVSIPADPTSLAQPPAVFKGSDALLGRGLRFRVQGKSADGTPGTPSAASSCQYSYSPPDAAALTLSASVPAQISFGGSTAATVTLSLGDDVNRNVGGVGSTIYLQLTGDGQTITQGPFTVDGTRSAVSASFSGVLAGSTYTASATVTTAHGGLTVTLPTAALTTRASWPATAAQGGPLSVSAQCAPTLLGCDLNVAINGLSSAQANGERFTLGAGSAIRCNNVAMELSLSDFDPASARITTPLSQLLGYYGRCTVQLVLFEYSDANPLYFGGTQSPTLATDVNLGQAQSGSAGQGDFTPSWSAAAGGSMEIQYAGTDTTLGQLTTDWQETLSSPSGEQCGTNSSQTAPGSNDATAHYIPISQGCIDRSGGSTAQWTVTISYDNKVDGASRGPFTALLAGPPPGYQTCAVTAADFSVQWGATPAATVQFTGNQNAIAGCSSWAYTLLDQNNATCSATTSLRDPAQTAVTLTASCATPPAGGWTVQITYENTAGDTATPLLAAVIGTPPPP